MNAQRLSSIVTALVLGLSGFAQAQGPWPTVNPPSVFSPIREFFTPRAYTAQAPLYAPTYSNSTQIVPGVPQCANGRCTATCPNGQCSNGSCANGRCTIPSTSYYHPLPGTSGCINGQCAPRSRTSFGTPNCTNGQCGLNNNGWNNSSLRDPVNAPAPRLRPMTPVVPQGPANRPITLNRLVPI